MNSQASLPQPHYLKLCGGFAKPISLAKADAKDLSHLLGGICPLNAFPFRSHMFSFHCAAHLWITVPPSDFLISRYRHSINSYSFCQRCRHVENEASTWLRPASPCHSPACAVGILTVVHRRNSLSSQWRAVVEVSLFPHGIVANALAAARLTGCVNRSSIVDTVLAPPCLPLPPHG